MDFQRISGILNCVASTTTLDDLSRGGLQSVWRIVNAAWWKVELRGITRHGAGQKILTESSAKTSRLSVGIVVFVLSVHYLIMIVFITSNLSNVDMSIIVWPVNGPILCRVFRPHPIFGDTTVSPGEPYASIPRRRHPFDLEQSMRAKSAVSSANTPDTASEMDPIIMRSDQIQAGGGPGAVVAWRAHTQARE